MKKESTPICDKSFDPEGWIATDWKMLAEHMERRARRNGKRVKYLRYLSQKKEKGIAALIKDANEARKELKLTKELLISETNFKNEAHKTIDYLRKQKECLEAGMKDQEILRLKHNLSKATEHIAGYTEVATEFCAVAQDYLGAGGLFNPELMEHSKVRDFILKACNDFKTLLPIKLNGK